MEWREAYMAQARSDYAVLMRLKASGVEYCHQLHYLQMTTEKLSKAMQTPVGAREPARASHVMFVRMLQVFKNRREFWKKTGFANKDICKEAIESLLDLAGKIERLSPDQAGFEKPNPEYPWWKDRSKTEVLAPSEYDFPEFNPKDFRMIRIYGLIEKLVKPD